MVQPVDVWRCFQKIVNVVDYVQLCHAGECILYCLDLSTISSLDALLRLIVNEKATSFREHKTRRSKIDARINFAFIRGSDPLKPFLRVNAYSMFRRDYFELGRFAYTHFSLSLYLVHRSHSAFSASISYYVEMR